jgi:signal transduction histidine kinase
VASPSPQRQIIDPTTFEQALDLLQQRIDLLQQNLSQQNKLATLGMVTAVLAHEFNNILTPMLSYTKFALSEKADEAMRTKALTKALSGATRLANISNSLLGFARGDDSTTANVKIAITETLACLSRELPKDGITLTLDTPDNLQVAMNAGQLQQVLMNLVVNARSAMLSGATNAGPKRLAIRGRIIKQEKIAEIIIADTGPGIPEDVLPRIFDPFFSTKRNSASAAAIPIEPTPDGDDSLPKGGTGLGLTICHELIAAAGGTIRADSLPGKGAIFTIELPAA